MTVRWIAWLSGLALLAVPIAAARGQATQTTPVGPPAPVTTTAPRVLPTTRPATQPVPAVAKPVTTSAQPAAQAVKHDEKPAAIVEIEPKHGESSLDYMSMVFVFMLATFIGIGVIRRVSRLLHTPLMSLTNAISAIAVVGSIMLAGGEHYPRSYKIVGAIAIFASMTNIVSGFLITDRMLKMFKTRKGGKA